MHATNQRKQNFGLREGSENVRALLVERGIAEKGDPGVIRAAIACEVDEKTGGQRRRGRRVRRNGS